MNFFNIFCDSANNQRKTKSNDSLGNNVPNFNSFYNFENQNMNYTGSSARNSLFQENVNPNKDLKSSYPTSIKNNFNNSRNSAYETYTANMGNHSNKTNKFTGLNILRKRTESSGKLLQSKRSSKHNKVVKDGNKIQNIDMNDDCQDTMKDDDSIINSSWNDPKNNLKAINNSLISNNKQSISTNVQPKQSIQPINNNLSSKIPIPINVNNKSQLQQRQSIRSSDGMKNRPVLNDNNSAQSKKEDESRKRKNSNPAPLQKLRYSEILNKSFSTILKF